jgi:hypothetical protein
MNALVEAENGLRDEVEPIPDELSAYWPSRIQEDRVWYSEYVMEDERFFAPNKYTDDPPHVYRLTDIEHNGDAFTLEPCGVTTADGTQTEPVTDADHTSTICDLAGAIELGELVHLPKGTLRTVGDTSFISVGDTTISISATGNDAESVLHEIDPPTGPTTVGTEQLTSTVAGMDAETSLYIPRSKVNKPVTAYHSVQPFSKWTFEDETIKGWAESHFEPGDRVLNACAGQTRLTPPKGGEIVRNDVNTEREADLHVDVAELAAHLEKESFDVIVFDPPWSLYQSNLRYNGNHVRKNNGGGTRIDLSTLPFETPDSDSKTQLGHARLAKENFHWLLKPEGKVIQITFHGTTMPARLEYQQENRVIFDPVGEAKSVIGSMDRKTEASVEKTLIPADGDSASKNDSPQRTLGTF